MKRVRQFLWSAFLFGPLVVMATPLQGTARPLFPDTVKELDIERFAGDWFEYASTRPGFQSSCVCTRTTYTPITSPQPALPTISVENRCLLGSTEGELSEAIGTATLPDPAQPGRLNVQFGGLRLPFTNYWVVELEADYSYAVVSSPLGTPIWVLTREAELPNGAYDGILARLKDRGFNTDRLQRTEQLGCPDL